MKKPELTLLMQRLLRTRAERGWSQNELARRSGVAPAQLSRYENGTSVPRPETLGKLANALSVDVEMMNKPELTPLMQRIVRTRAERGWS